MRYVAQHGYRADSGITMVTADTKETTFVFRQRMSMALRKGDAVTESFNTTQ